MATTRCACILSALGQKQTYAVHKGMSALSATAKADSRKRSCLLYPRKRTCAAHKPMSAKCQKRTWTELFDHLVGAEQDGLGYFEAERLGDFAIEDKLKLRYPLDRKISGFGAFENSCPRRWRRGERLQQSPLRNLLRHRLAGHRPDQSREAAPLTPARQSLRRCHRQSVVTKLRMEILIRRSPSTSPQKIRSSPKLRARRK